jgi:uncharacterized protein YprB with RNaseH-like and TPR domain
MPSWSIPDAITFDIETQRAGDVYDIETSLMSIIDNKGGVKVFEWDEIGDAIDRMLGAPRLVSFNGKAFDLQVLRKYCTRAEYWKLAHKPHYDLFDEWMRKRRTFNSLNNFAEATLHMNKFNRTGISAPEEWRQGRIQELTNYNVHDSYLTYLLFLFVEINGYVWCKMPVTQKFVPECTFRAA